MNDKEINRRIDKIHSTENKYMRDAYLLSLLVDLIDNDFHDEIISRASISENRSTVSIKLPYIAYVYFLFKGDELVYVGKSKRSGRISGHHKEKNFDGIQYIPFMTSLYHDAERILIWAFGGPKYNQCSLAIQAREEVKKRNGSK